MKALSLISACALAAAFAIVVVQKNAISKLREQNETLRAQKDEALRLANENGQIPALHAASDETEHFRAANQELPRLRNEVRQWREQKPQIEKLRLENQRLASAIKSAPAAPRRFSEMEGFAAKETWANVGFASPETTVLTWCWAIREGDLKQIAACFSPEEKKAFEGVLYGKSEQEQKELVEEGLSPFRKGKGFRIGEKKIIADDEVVLDIQMSADGEILHLPLRRFGNEWKIHALH